MSCMYCSAPHSTPWHHTRKTLATPWTKHTTTASFWPPGGWGWKALGPGGGAAPAQRSGLRWPWGWGDTEQSEHGSLSPALCHGGTAHPVNTHTHNSTMQKYIPAKLVFLHSSSGIPINCAVLYCTCSTTNDLRHGLFTLIICNRRCVKHA